MIDVERMPSRLAPPSLHFSSEDHKDLEVLSSKTNSLVMKPDGLVMRVEKDFDKKVSPDIDKLIKQTFFNNPDTDEMSMKALPKDRSIHHYLAAQLTKAGFHYDIEKKVSDGRLKFYNKKFIQPILHLRTSNVEASMQTFLSEESMRFKQPPSHLFIKALDNSKSEFNFFMSLPTSDGDNIYKLSAVLFNVCDEKPRYVARINTKDGWYSVTSLRTPVDEEHVEEVCAYLGEIYIYKKVEKRSIKPPEAPEPIYTKFFEENLSDLIDSKERAFLQGLYERPVIFDECQCKITDSKDTYYTPPLSFDSDNKLEEVVVVEDKISLDSSSDDSTPQQ